MKPQQQTTKMTTTLMKPQQGNKQVKPQPQHNPHQPTIATTKHLKQQCNHNNKQLKQTTTMTRKQNKKPQQQNSSDKTSTMNQQ